MKSNLYILVGPWTKVGDIFRFSRNEVCDECRFNKICYKGKKEGMLYRIVSISKPKTTVYCKLIDSEALLATVEESYIEVSVSSRSAIPGIKIKYNAVRCSEYRCPYIKYCVLNGSILTDEIEVGEVMQKLDCPIGLDLSLVKARPVDYSSQ